MGGDLYLRRGIAEIKPYSPGKPMDEVKRELGLTKVVKLASNENPLGPSPKAVRALQRAAKDVWLYPDGGCYQLRNALGQHWKLTPEHFIFGTGGDDVISMIGRAFVDQGSECIIPHPSFGSYDITVRIMGGVPVYSPLKGYRQDIDDIISKMNPRTKVVFICNPLNPTGDMVTREELEAVMAHLPPAALLLLDEAYGEYADDPKYPAGLPYFLKDEKNPQGWQSSRMVIIRTFSKIYAVAGLRVGYGITRPDIANALERVREAFNVNSLAQAAALAALSDKEHYKKSRQMVWKEKKILYRELKSLGIEYHPTQSNFLWVKVPRDDKVLFEEFLKMGLILRMGSALGMPNHFRVTIGTRGQNLFFLKCMKKALGV
jgi:histidinol-phosphate aminotransferase